LFFEEAESKNLDFTGRMALQAPFLPKFHPSSPKLLLTCPKAAKIKHDRQKNNEKSVHIILGAFL